MKDLLVDESPRFPVRTGPPRGDVGRSAQIEAVKRCDASGARTQKNDRIEARRVSHVGVPFAVLAAVRGEHPVRVGSYDSSRLSARTGKMHRARESRPRRVVAIKTPPDAASPARSGVLDAV